jgi:transcriptional regulator with GAF, ATPase, and Fis domain
MADWAAQPVAGLQALSGLVGSGVRGLFARASCRRRTWIVIASLLVCGYAAWVLLYVKTTPELGFRCAFSPTVSDFHGNHFLYPPGQEPLLQGDRIVRIADQPIENWLQLVRRIIQPRHELPVPLDDLPTAKLTDQKLPGFVLVHRESVARVVYTRPGDPADSERIVWCRLVTPPLETLSPSVLWFLLKIGLFVVGAVVFWKLPEDRSAGQFFWLCILSFGAYMGGYHWLRIVTQPVLLLVFMGCAVFLPAVTLHFYLIFPRPKPFLDRLRGRVMLVVYGPPSLFLLLLLSGYLSIRLDGASKGVQVLLDKMLVEIYFYFVIAALYYLASLASLIHSYLTAANAVERKQITWILGGALAAAVPIGYTLYLAFCEPVHFGGGWGTWPMFTASALVTVAYTISITRYRLMQLGQLVSSGMVYILLSSLAGLLYSVVFAGMVLLGSHLGDGPSFGQVLGVSGSTLLLLIALDLGRGRLKNALDRHFRREKIQLDRTLQRMSQAIGQLVDPRDLARRLLQSAVELLGARAGAIYIREGEPALYRLADAHGAAPQLTELSSGCPLVEALQAGPTLGPHLLYGKGPGGPVVRQLHYLGGEVAVALTHEGQLLGLLVLGPREQADYGADDLHLLASFCQVTALALVSAEGHRLIDRLNCELKEKVEKIAEQQRRIVALQTQLVAQRRAEKPDTQPTEKGDEPLAPPSIPTEGVVGSSPQVQNLLQMVRRVAVSSSAVLLRGETGTGKELLARALHENSPRAGRPFVKVVCASLSAGLLESELFGHVKGAFTSAIRDKVGRFEAANGGTLFLDEIGDVSPEVQTKLLRVLEEMTFERVGSSDPVHVDVRIIAATHQGLESLIQQGRFRQDLFFRLNVLPIHLPPLRDRIEDIPELVEHFIRLCSHRCGKEVAGIEDDALALLKSHRWPGNIRELENAIERAVVIAERPLLTIPDLPGELLADFGEVRVVSGVGEPSGLPETALALLAERGERDRREREQLVRTLAAANGNKSEAARALGMARSTFVSRLKKLGLG